uniref:cytochrome b n=1 Tax=Sclerodermus sichuanensis TaxID=592144 RepID=UPI0021139C6E|nr:cytochrome b [Sclerodermus sichuanensis]UTN43179.1 cytochrome b [Sclerodermus sichuanensis]
MNKSIMNSHFKIINESLINLPTPININTWWSFGSMLGITLSIQLISGLFLSMHYSPSTIFSFQSIIHINNDINYGYLLRFLHMNGASMYFICMYIHIARNIYFQSYKLFTTWAIGIIIFLTSMATAFLGYILPWGQMSFWAATVITNLLSSIPYIGNTMVMWLWGGFSVNNATLNRFYSLHFLLPFIITIFVINHLISLHTYGSSNPLGIKSNMMKIPFHSYYSFKDLVGFMTLSFILTSIILTNPNMFNDPDNFILANPMVTPIHIQPEWYFLFAYTILRSIPNKLGGVISLLMSILILFSMSFTHLNKMNSTSFYPINKFYYWIFINNFILLTWAGMKPIEFPFYTISQILTISYFMFFIINPIIMKLWDKMIFIPTNK